MPVFRSFAQKIPGSRSLYLQLLFVTLAFTLMVVSTSIFVNNMLENYLRREAENMLSQTQIRIMNELREPETLMLHIVKDVRDIILSGGGVDDVQGYFNEISAELLKREDGFVFVGLDGYFEALGNVYIPAPQWNVPDDYNATERPWYKAAVAADGKMAMSPAFMSMRSGKYQINLVSRIFDDEGKALGVVTISIGFDNITKYVTDMHIVEGGYGFLADENFELISHHEADFIAQYMNDISPGFRQIVNIMEEGESFSRIEQYNYMDVYSVFHCKRLDNGWYLGLMTPKNIYNRNLKILTLFLGVLGVGLMLAVNFILIRIDISKNKAQASIAQMQKTIEEKNKLANLGHILNSLATMICVIDPATYKILFINDNMRRHYGIEGDGIGQICYQTLQRDKDKQCDFCPRLKLDQEPDSIVIWEDYNALTNRICRNADRFIDWPNGAKVHLQHSVDITDLRTMADNLIEAKEAAEQSSRSKGIFLAHMSHEIRTPMNAILGISEIQLQNKTIPPDAEEAFEQIYDSGSLLLNIINDVLDFSKIEAGKLEIVPSKYNVPSLINDTVQINLLRYESKPLEFNLDLDENTPFELHGDELRIKQILNNLFSNAFKYTDKGEIRLSVYTEPMKDNKTVMLIFRISDTGQGMSEDQLAKLFDEYSRFNMEANRAITGTGLGMNIVKGLIDMMGGEISVESEAGKGTTFTVCLPQEIIGPAVCGTELADNLRNFRFHNMPNSKRAQIAREYMPYGSVLVVDDVASNLYVAKGLLTPYGLRIETAKSGTEAIERIKAGNVYDIVFMDHMMPVMDGMEAVKIIRDMGYTHTIVALTANAVVGQSDIFLANGFDGFISKPIDSRQLNAALNHFIRDKQPQEVIEATRREQRESKSSAAGPETKDMSEIYRFFVLDAENAQKVMEESCAKLPDAQALDSYVIAVHGMKNVLANIGEAELSAAAHRLEQAGNERNFAVIAEKTPAFTGALMSLIDKYRPAHNDDTIEITGEDTVYLRDKLLAIKTACAAFDVTAAKEALDNLRQKTWPRDVQETLDEISVHLLHSAFKKAAAIAENRAKT